MDFICDILLDKVLIALELHRAVSADALVVVTLDSVVECVHADVENAIVRICVLVDDLVYRTWFIMRREGFRSHEVALVEVSLSDRNKVEYDKENHSHSDDGHSALSYE